MVHAHALVFLFNASLNPGVLLYATRARCTVASVPPRAAIQWSVLSQIAGVLSMSRLFAAAFGIADAIAERLDAEFDSQVVQGIPTLPRRCLAEP